MEQKTNVFYHGDCLFVMRHDIPKKSVDLIYLDPPFFTGKVQRGKTNWDPGAMQISYEDSKSFWGSSEKQKAMRDKAPEWLKNIGVKQPQFASYIFYIMERLYECEKILKDTGSIYLHCDYRASHYLKMVMDEVFGYGNFRNEIVWYYKGGWKSNRWFARKHDVILFYTKSSKYTFNMDDVLERFPDDVIKDHKRYPLKDKKGFYGIHHGKKYYMKETKRPDDVWDIPFIVPTSKERTGYPTQKPEALLERIINASSNKGDIVLDPFCGCGTTVIKAHKLNRRWIGIDINEVSFDIISKRCNQTKLDNPLKTTIMERTLESIVKIIEEDSKIKGQKFERWVNEFYGGTKPYPDDGVDIIMEDGTPIQVKSYIVGDSEIRRFAGDARDHPKVPQPCNRGLVVGKGFNDKARQQVYITKENRGFEVIMIEPKDMLKTEDLTK